MQYDLVLSIVNHGFADDVIDASQSVGATGATILHARGSGRHTETIYGVRIDPEKDFVLMLVERTKCKAVMQAVYEKVGLGSPGSGICFALPVDDVVGLKTL